MKHRSVTAASCSYKEGCAQSLDCVRFLRPYGLQHPRLPSPSLSPRVCSSLCPLSPVMPSNHLILCHPLLLLPSIFPSISLFQWVGCLHQLAKVLELQLQHQSFQWIFRIYHIYTICSVSQGFPGGPVVKNPPTNARNTGSIPGLGRSHMPDSN